MRRLFHTASIVASAVVLTASLSQADPTYDTILELNDSATGVRGTDTTNSGNVILTGSQQVSGVTQGLLWSGNLYSNIGTYYTILPEVSGTLSGSIYYGPDTHAFNSLIPEGQIRAVGTYQLDGVDGTFGFMYQGALQSGTYAVTAINVQDAVNTIPHSTAGSIVVGAYDKGTAQTGNSFIFDLTDSSFKSLTLGNESSLYGVWHVGGDKYVIIGGARNPGAADANQAFIANYDLATNTVSDKTFYTFNDQGGAISHFEGITAVDGGYNVIATVTDNGDGSAIGAALAFISVTDGAFNPNAVWTGLDVNGSDLTTGNTVYENVGIGVYATSGSANVNTYTATVPEPSTYALVALGLAALVYGLRRRATA
ncbi:hypothetical protein DB345_05390 [Spartobacteria bacterium LR76]|nr:hypothetical protein DB345_05390 [Spartobacteria bacterium LR76]